MDQLKFIEENSPLPLNLKLGLSFRPLSRLQISGDVSNPADNKAYAGFGMEYIIGRVFSVRGGYTSHNDFNQGITFGAGFNVMNWIIDYAFVPYGQLDNTHRITISAKFN